MTSNTQKTFIRQKKTRPMDGVAFGVSGKKERGDVVDLKKMQKRPSGKTKREEVGEVVFHAQLDEKFERWVRSVEEYTRKSAAVKEVQSKKEVFATRPTAITKTKRQAPVNLEAKKRLDNFLVSNAQKEAETVLEPRSAKQYKKKSSGTSFWKHFFANYKNLGLFDDHSLGNVGKPALAFTSFAVVILVLLGLSIYGSYGFQIQEDVQILGKQAIGHLESAKQEMENRNFVAANASFENALASFAQAQGQLDLLGGDMLDMFSNFPLLSKASSGKNVVYAGNELTKSAKELAAVVALFSSIENPLDQEKEEKTSLIDIFLQSQEHISTGKEHLASASKHIDKVNIEDLPVDYQEKFRKIEQALPIAISTIEDFQQHSEIFLELLGHNGPRKYLLLFQNNHEIRPTGGFIGSYGLLHISNGEIKKLLIDGIFNPDGQFREDIIPPQPLQKITAGWSTHDANWFPHFPDSARKIAAFYEKTEGPTVDGIITMTPVVMERMLEITGPIEMPEYQITISDRNFIRETQYKVEVDYDKEENRPKKFLADLAPEILDRIFAVSDPEDASKVIATLSDSLREKHILLHSFEKEVQEVISKRGWSGEIAETAKDYLMVINTNINGYKTDGIIDEKIFHNSEIMPNGTIINTVRIKRTHNGGDSEYEWWNKVNSNYMRVYVPKGSELISVSGQTREFIEPPLDYEKLGFEKDEDISAQEEGMVIDEETGTRIYEEGNKTVFANWTYVSPKETMEIEYVYRLPFRVDLNENSEQIDSYSLLAQKQPGSLGSAFQSEIKFAENVDVVWKYPENIELEKGKIKSSKTLNVDEFMGIVLQKN